MKDVQSGAIRGVRPSWSVAAWRVVAGCLPPSVVSFYRFVDFSCGGACRTVIPLGPTPWICDDRAIRAAPGKVSLVGGQEGRTSLASGSFRRRLVECAVLGKTERSSQAP